MKCILFHCPLTILMQFLFNVFWSQWYNFNERSKRSTSAHNTVYGLCSTVVSILRYVLVTNMNKFSLYSIQTGWIEAGPHANSWEVIPPKSRIVTLPTASRSSQAADSGKYWPLWCSILQWCPNINGCNSLVIQSEEGRVVCLTVQEYDNEMSKYVNSVGKIWIYGMQMIQKAEHGSVRCQYWGHPEC